MHIYFKPKVQKKIEEKVLIKRKPIWDLHVCTTQRRCLELLRFGASCINAVDN